MKFFDMLSRKQIITNGALILLGMFSVVGICTMMNTIPTLWGVVWAICGLSIIILERTVRYAMIKKILSIVLICWTLLLFVLFFYHF